MTKALDIARQLKASTELLRRRINTAPPKKARTLGHGEAKVLFFDIETAPLTGLAWSTYQTDILKVTKDWFMLSFAAKWAHDDKVLVKGLCDYPNFRKDMSNDKALAGDLHALIKEADVVVGHNGDNFDIKKSNARFIQHGFDPPGVFKTVDTLKLARKNFKFTSNRLNDIGRMLNLGQKLPHKGLDLWVECMEGNPNSWKTMKDYNAQDVLLLEKVYYRLRPWSSSHPNLNLYRDDHDCKCPKCESVHVQRRGFEIKKTTKVQRFQCQDCGSWFSHGPSIKTEEKVLQKRS